VKRLLGDHQHDPAPAARAPLLLERDERRRHRRTGRPRAQPAPAGRGDGAAGGPDSPAARIGLRPGTIPATVEGKPFLLGGDIILAVQGQRIGAETYEALQERMSRLPAGSAISVIVLREGREVTLTAVKD